MFACVFVFVFAFALVGLSFAVVLRVLCLAVLLVVLRALFTVGLVLGLVCRVWFCKLKQKKRQRLRPCGFWCVPFACWLVVLFYLFIFLFLTPEQFFALAPPLVVFLLVLLVVGTRGRGFGAYVSKFQLFFFADCFLLPFSAP